ncbi:CGNR zinc finger domain-containing protein [Saccharopolyspora erythraea]|uniref:CGNR zinc finger domain-containing protein n=1 Tax=Saccharopolyspora erythraea TaxID=1836 RepID=UPI001BA808CD|nr:CGNR zinc finger domain-containing protein [Saccharopolyspora erythraea]QUH02396.1 CGNR zinc finger domain-containing protein [Saccharopolyspora erythraea]
MQVLLDDYVWASGIATALVNTAPEVAVSTGDLLADPDSLGRFLAGHGIHPDALADGRTPTTEDIAEVHEVRGVLREAIEAPDAATTTGLVESLLRDVAHGPGLRQDADGRWQWSVGSRPDARAAEEVALVTGVGLLSTLRVLGHDRFRGCGSPTCNGVFVDTSRGGRRRYCEPEICGNRLNVAKHRARARAAREAAQRRERSPGR